MKPTYILFIDESGVGNLNNTGRFFVLGTILIHKSDYEIIEGYLRLLKRRYLLDDFRIIHTTDLFERPYLKYRRLWNRHESGKFIKELKSILSNIPYKVAIYYVDKNKVRANLGYVPASGRRNPQTDLPYKMCSLEAIEDFTKFLIREKAIGEIIIESRQNNDTHFVEYFDEARKFALRGGATNPIARETAQRINSLLIANKRIVNGGLEIADICSYVAYRKLTGDPDGNLKININYALMLYHTLVENAYVRGLRGRRLKEIII